MFLRCRRALLHAKTCRAQTPALPTTGVIDSIVQCCPVGADEPGLLRQSSAARTSCVDCANTPASKANVTKVKTEVDLYSGMPALLDVTSSTRSETNLWRGLETAIGAAIRCKFGKYPLPQW